MTQSNFNPQILRHLYWDTTNMLGLYQVILITFCSARICLFFFQENRLIFLTRWQPNSNFSGIPKGQDLKRIAQKLNKSFWRISALASKMGQIKRNKCFFFTHFRGPSKHFVCFLGNGVSRKIIFEISWPSLEKIDGNRVGKQTIDGNSRRILLSLPYS